VSDAMVLQNRNAQSPLQLVLQSRLVAEGNTGERVTARLCSDCRVRLSTNRLHAHIRHNSGFHSTSTHQHVYSRQISAAAQLQLGVYPNKSHRHCVLVLPDILAFI
jgi:hypothetical protein